MDRTKLLYKETGHFVSPVLGDEEDAPRDGEERRAYEDRRKARLAKREAMIRFGIDPDAPPEPPAETRDVLRILFPNNEVGDKVTFKGRFWRIVGSLPNGHYRLKAEKATG